MVMKLEAGEREEMEVKTEGAPWQGFYVFFFRATVLDTFFNRRHCQAREHNAVSPIYRPFWLMSFVQRELARRLDLFRFRRATASRALCCCVLLIEMTRIAAGFRKRARSLSVFFKAKVKVKKRKE